MDIASFEIEFDKRGNLFEPHRLQAAIDGLAAGKFTDVFVFSHGWNNNVEDARALYERFFANASALLAEGKVAAMSGRKPAALKLFWPSKKFEEKDLIPGGGAASTGNGVVDQSVMRQLDELKRDPLRLGQNEENPVATAAVEQAKALYPRLEKDPAARQQFVLHLRSLLNPDEAHADDASEEFFTADPENLLAAMKDPVVLPAGLAGGAAGGAAGVGGAASFVGDLISGIRGSAHRLLNFTTYFQMKQRAGTVGRVGLAPALREIRQRLAEIRIHLIGHSFGGRVVAAAAHALDDDTAVQSMTLLQAAFSHNGLAEKFDRERGGAFRSLITRRRVTGPICVTYTHNDKAVGVAYPLASRISRDQAAALGDANDPYGGMGRNGAQRTPEAVDRHGKLRNYRLLSVGDTWPIEPRMVHNFESSAVIADHNAVTGKPVAYLAMTAAAST
jgi:pimeloyl-ACP methyl ester carboxylesterase